MATPRKYPTLGEFEELKEAVARIEAQLARKPAQSSVYVDAQQVAEALGLTDAHGVPVAVGDRLRALEGGDAREVLAVNVFAAKASDGKATVHAQVTGGVKLTAVDMRLSGYEVEKRP